MLDLHVLYDGTGAVTLMRPATIPSNDGAVVAGVPINTERGRANLVAWGVVCLAAANGPKEVTLQSQDQMDVANQSIWLPTGASVMVASPIFKEWLPFSQGARVVKAAQKAAGLLFSYTIDHYASSGGRGQTVRGSYAPPRRGVYSTTFGGALTAQAWGSASFAPTANLPTGRYAILGAWVTALTNAAALRFSHNDFGGMHPGIPVADTYSVAATLPALGGNELLLPDGLQFVRMGELIGQPCCPVFTAGTQGTGLAIEVFDNTADTPTVILNLAQISG